MDAPPPISPRRTPVQARARATAEAIVEAAAHILEADGPAALNTNAVAIRAGVSIGSLYQYFPGKDAVMAALIAREAGRFALALDAALKAAEGLAMPEAVRLLAGAAVTHQARRPRLARLLDVEEQRLRLGDAAGEATLARLASFLEARGVADAEQAAADLLGLARGLIDAALERGDDRRLDVRVARAALGYLGSAPEC